MTDIVERLKDAENATHALFNHIFQDAREEIERLRIENDALRAEVIHIKEVEFPRKAQAVAEGWRGKCERLEAKIAEMEKQEPVGTLHDDGCFVWRKTAPHQSNYAGWKMVLYALPGAQPAPSVPECPYPCGWRNLLKHTVSPPGTRPQHRGRAGNGKRASRDHANGDALT